MNALTRAIEIVGNQTKLAEKVGGGQSRISEWIRRGKVADSAVLKVSGAVDFQVTPHELRPDLYPHPDDGLPADLRSRGAAL